MKSPQSEIKFWHNVGAKSSHFGNMLQSKHFGTVWCSNHITDSTEASSTVACMFWDFFMQCFQLFPYQTRTCFAGTTDAPAFFTFSRDSILCELERSEAIFGENPFLV